MAAIITYWNTLKLGDAIFAKKQAGLEAAVDNGLGLAQAGWGSMTARSMLPSGKSMTSCRGSTPSRVAPRRGEDVAGVVLEEVRERHDGPGEKRALLPAEAGSSI